jgi:hypothetical protein
MRTSKTPGEYILIALPALLFCWLGYRTYLNYIGYCPAKGRVLTEQEKLAPVIQWLALSHPVEAEPPKVPPEEERLYYDSIPEFLRENPDCCHVAKEFYDADAGWVRLGLGQRLCGFVSDYVAVKFYLRYRDKNGAIRRKQVQGGYALTPCGKIVDWM